MCNVVRDKNYGSKNLFKKTGVVCGARGGASNVYEPVLLGHRFSRKNFVNESAYSKPATSGSFLGQPDDFLKETNASNAFSTETAILIRPNT